MMPYQMPDDDENYKKLLLDQLQAPPPVEDQNMGTNQLVASLSGSLNKLGTVGGRTADNSDVQRYADVLDKSKAQRDTANQGQSAKRQQILFQLASLKDKGLQNQQKQDFDTKRDAAQFEQQKSLISMKNDNAKDLMVAKAENAPEKGPKPATADEKNYAYHATRAKNAEDLINQIEQSGYDPTSYVAAGRGLGGNLTMNGPDRSYDKAKRAFIASVLRKESGAAVSPQEFTNYEKIYFPQPGDGPEQVAQAAAERKRAAEMLAQGAGVAYDPKTVQPFQYTPPAGQFDAYAASAPKNEMPAAGPKVGDVIKGYQFNGGDPADKKNWTKREEKPQPFAGE